MTPHELYAWAKWAQPYTPWVGAGLATSILGSKMLYHRHYGRGKQDAHWATSRELRDAYLLGYDGLVLGKYHRWILRYCGPVHALIVAKSQTGKSNAILVPTLLEPQPQRSFLIHDPKGELAAITKAYRSTVSHVAYLDPSSMNSDHLNPWDRIRLDTVHEFEDTQLICEILTNPTNQEIKDENARHWINISSDTLHGLIIYGLHRGFMHPAALLELITLGDWAHIMDDMEQDSHDEVQRAWTILKRDNSKAREAIMDTIREALRQFRDPIIARMCSKSDFGAEELRMADSKYSTKAPLTVYYSVPFPKMSPTLALTRLMLRQLLGASMTQLKGHDFKLDVFFDETPSLKHFEIIPEGLDQVAGYGIRFTVVTPSFEHLVDIYGPHHNFLTGAYLKCYFAIDDGPTTKQVSERLGKHTEVKRRVTYSRGTRSITREYVEKPMLSPEAIADMDSGTVIAIAGRAKVLLRQTPWYNHSPWRKRGTFI
jgi:type IV secretion system protein VirD4